MHKNNNLPRRPVDLSGGGDSWNGWIFGPYGRAREFRLISPDGAAYTPGDLWDMRGHALNVDALRGQVRELEALTDATAYHFTAAELRAIEAAAEILGRLRARPRRRRMAPALHAVKIAR